MKKYLFPIKNLSSNRDFFYSVEAKADYPDEYKPFLFDAANKTLNGELLFYSRHWQKMGNPPKWFLNPFNNNTFASNKAHWTEIKDFNHDVGDIKNVWESSRFDWIVVLAKAYRVTGDVAYLDRLNEWLSDWCQKNPVNLGPNWKCGQEASIRVFNLLMTSSILDQWNNSTQPLINLVFLHLIRIFSNIKYAISLDNNHSTSEAAALFIGGSWLAQLSEGKIRNKSLSLVNKGKRWLEERVAFLVENDGSFSQHSVTYHRVLLDTLSFSEYWRLKLNLEAFSDRFYQKVKSAIGWLTLLTDPVSGNAPNLGGNDGARLIGTQVCEYRDFRPSLQTATSIFLEQQYFDSGPWDEPLYWFGIDKSPYTKKSYGKKNTLLKGGYLFMFNNESWGMLRLPVFKFRPAHNDVFHLDLWSNGRNIIRDAGSFSYFPDDKSDYDYFKSVRAHNTVCFDDSEQMPIISRFLLGKWINKAKIGKIAQSESGRYRWTGSYYDYKGNHHQRTIFWANANWTIEDKLAGSFKEAKIIFRLIPGNYKLENNLLTAFWGKIKVESNDAQVSLVKGYESLHYWEKSAIDVLLIKVGNNKKKTITKINLIS